MSIDVPPAVYDELRLEAVQASRLLETAAEEPFDRLTRLAALVLDVPLAFMTVVDDRRSWYKSCVGLPAEAERSGAVEESFCQYVVGTNAALLVADTRTDARTKTNPAIDSMGVAAWAGFPVHSPSGEILGTFCVVDSRPHSWTELDAQILETLAHAASGEVALRAALADANETQRIAEEGADASAALAARLFESSEKLDHLARTLQQSLLPPHLPDVPGVDLAASYVAAAGGEEVVGDFYDVFESRPDEWCVLLGDVCGKGPEAASLTAMARYTLRAAAVRSARPSKVLATLNTAMLHQRPDDERFLTVVYAVIRRQVDHLAVWLCSAGHPPPLLRRADGTLEPTSQPGMPLGLFDQPTLVDTEILLGPGDALIYYSDGVTEARRGKDQLGIDGLLAILADAPRTDAAGLVHHVQAAVATYRQGPPRDDTAVLVVRLPNRHE